MKLELPVPFKNEGWVSADAEFVDVAPHLANVATFAVHKAVGPDAGSGWWLCANVETGMHVAYSIVKRRALRKAREVLSAKSEADMLAAYKKANRLFPKLRPAS